jgi:hypothetical protein
MRVFVIHSEAARMQIVSAIMAAPKGYQVRIGEPSRTVDQNAAQWPILDAFSKQLQWPVNGALTYMEPEEWKDVLTAAFEHETRTAEGLNGGHVILGHRTSAYTKQRFSEYLDFINSVAAERGVKTEL